MAHIAEKTDTVLPQPKTDRAGFLKCRVCGCTERAACNPPCGWQQDELDLCTGCADAVHALWVWADGAHRPKIPALIQELKRQIALGSRAKAGGR